MAFKDIRRQKFLGEANANEFEEDLLYRIEQDTPDVTNSGLVRRIRRSAAWTVATSALELLLLRYTAGRPVSELADEVPAVINAFDIYIALEIPPRQETPPRNEAETLEITQHEAYVYVLWLLALCRLLGHQELIPMVMTWIDRNAEYNRGRDGLFESIVDKLTRKGQPCERRLFHPVYKPLAKATVAEPADRPPLVKEFVENWYKNMKPCYWYGTHTDKEGSSYFGYWCLEAALVTVLWDIDDSSYRDHLVYPKDLVDFARSLPPSPREKADRRYDRCEGGKPCPREGFWWTPAADPGTGHFKKGEIMSDYPLSSYGSTIWYRVKE